MKSVGTVQGKCSYCHNEETVVLYEEDSKDLDFTLECLVCDKGNVELDKDTVEYD